MLGSKPACLQTPQLDLVTPCTLWLCAEVEERAPSESFFPTLPVLGSFVGGVGNLLGMGGSSNSEADSATADRDRCPPWNTPASRRAPPSPPAPAVGLAGRAGLLAFLPVWTIFIFSVSLQEGKLYALTCRSFKILLVVC